MSNRNRKQSRNPNENPNENSNENSNQSFISEELTSVKLDAIAKAIIAFGFTLTAMASALAIQEAEALAQSEDTPSTKDLEKNLRKIQKKIDHLSRQFPRM